MGAVKERYCPMCMRMRPRDRFPRYTCRDKVTGQPRGHVFGGRCFECGARPVRHGEDLDAAIMRLEPEDGVCWDIHSLAAKVGCSPQTILNIEAKAMRKLRRRAMWLAKLFEGWL